VEKKSKTSAHRAGPYDKASHARTARRSISRHGDRSSGLPVRQGTNAGLKSTYLTGPTGFDRVRHVSVDRAD
jgi:hypothetical protein